MHTCPSCRNWAVILEKREGQAFQNKSTWCCRKCRSEGKKENKGSWWQVRAGKDRDGGLSLLSLTRTEVWSQA